MNKKEYLNEEWYQNTKKKIVKISLIILIVSILIGGGLIATGIIKTNISKKEAQKIYEERVAEANKRLDEIEQEKETLNKQYELKNQECDSISMSDPDWFSKKSSCSREVNKIASKITELETEEFKLNNAFSIFYFKNYTFLSIIGGIVIFIGGIIALAFYVIAKRREITAFGVQQVMPLAQEGMEKMAPTIGTVGKEIAKGISSGIKEGTQNNKGSSSNNV